MADDRHFYLVNKSSQGEQGRTRRIISLGAHHFLDRKHRRDAKQRDKL